MGWETIQHISRNYRSLKWYYISIAFSDSGTQAFGVILLTYLADLLDFFGVQTGIGISMSLIGTIPGSFIATFISRRLDPLKSTIIYQAYWIVNASLFLIFLTGPDQLVRTYVILFSCGCSAGWKHTMDRIMSASLIPEGQDTELMSIYLFAGQSLNWLPLMIFTLLNENGFTLRESSITMVGPMLVALFCYFLVGSYIKA